MCSTPSAVPTARIIKQWIGTKPEHRQIGTLAFGWMSHRSSLHDALTRIHYIPPRSLHTSNLNWNFRKSFLRVGRVIKIIHTHFEVFLCLSAFYFLCLIIVFLLIVCKLWLKFTNSLFLNSIKNICFIYAPIFIRKAESKKSNLLQTNSPIPPLLN